MQTTIEFQKVDKMSTSKTESTSQVPYPGFKLWQYASWFEENQIPSPWISINFNCFAQWILISSTPSIIGLARIFLLFFYKILTPLPQQHPSVW